MAENMGKWPSKRGPITKIMPSGGGKGDTAPLALGQWYDFHDFGCHPGNPGKMACAQSPRKLSPNGRRRAVARWHDPTDSDRSKFALGRT